MDYDQTERPPSQGKTDNSCLNKAVWYKVYGYPEPFPILLLTIIICTVALVSLVLIRSN